MIFKIVDSNNKQPVKRPEQGDLVRWVKNNIGDICMVTYSGLTRLNYEGGEAGGTWEYPMDVIYQRLQDGSLQYLPKGTLITLEQE